jgi:PKD domain
MHSAAIGRYLRAAGLACALCLLGAPAASAAVWLPPQDLSTPGRDATNPVIAMDDVGTTAVWEKDNTANAGFHGEASTRAPGAAFTAPAELAPGVTEPQVGMTGGGQAVAAWKRLVNPPGTYVIEAATRPAGGAFLPAVDVATMPKSVIPNALEIAVNANGDTAVVWTRPDPDSVVDKNATFVEASVRPAGGSFSEPARVSLPIVENQSAGQPAVAIDADGNVVVDWVYDNGTNSVVEAAERPAGGDFSSPDVISGAGQDAFHPDVATDAGGNAIAVWTESDGADTIIQASFRPDNGIFEAADDLSEAGDSAFEPRVAMTPGGLATAVWTRSVEGELFIETSSRPPGGDFSSPPEEVTAGGEPVGPIDPDLAMNAAGDALVAWSGFTSKGESVVKASVRPGAGAFSAPEEISVPSPGFAHPDTAIAGSANATVVWVRSNGANEIAQAAGYDASPPEMRGLSIPSSGTVGVPVSFSASPFDFWPIVSTTFAFGDGSGAAGTSVSHTYSAPGSYQVTATAVDAAGTPVSASGTIAISPSYQFRIGKKKRNRKRGTIALTIEVSGPGEVSVSGKKVKGKRKRASGAGAVTITVAAKGKALKQLKEKGKARVRVKVSFAPDGGDHAASSSITLVLKKKLAS